MAAVKDKKEKPDPKTKPKKSVDRPRNRALSEQAKQLQECEEHIRLKISEGEAVTCEIGKALLRIKQDELYLAAGAEDFDAYLAKRVSADFGIARAHSYRLMAIAQIQPKLPERLSSSSPGETRSGCGWSQKEMLEFGRLAPETDHAQRRDYDQLDPKVVTRVIKRAEVLAGGTPKKRVTQAAVRRAVDAELGKVRGPKPAPESEPEPTPEPAPEGDKGEGSSARTGASTGKEKKQTRTVTEPRLPPEMVELCRSLAQRLAEVLKKVPLGHDVASLVKFHAGKGVSDEATNQVKEALENLSKRCLELIKKLPGLERPKVEQDKLVPFNA
jgi:hypothetical protein